MRNDNHDSSYIKENRPEAREGAWDNRFLISQDTLLMTDAEIFLASDLPSSEKETARQSHYLQSTNPSNMLDITVFHGSRISISQNMLVRAAKADYTLHGNSHLKHYRSLPKFEDAKWIPAYELEEGDWVFSQDRFKRRALPFHRFDLSEYIPKGSSNYHIEGDHVIWTCQHTFKSHGYDGLRTREIAEALSLTRNDVKTLLYNDDQSLHDIFLKVENYLEKFDMTVGTWRATMRSPQDIELPRYLNIDETFAYLIGFYVADGDVHGGCVQFALDKSKPDEIQRVKDAMGNVFPNIPRHISDSNGPEGKGICYSFSIPLFAALVKELVPGTVRTKQFPEMLFHCDDDQLVTAMLFGYIDGDGSAKNNRLSATSVSSKLIFQTHRLLMMPTSSSTSGRIFKISIFALLQ